MPPVAALHTRRAALGGGAAALALASCGGGDPPPSTGAKPGSGAALLGSLLALERAVIAAYEYSANQFDGDTARYTRVIREHEESAAFFLAQQITDLGGDPPAGRPAAEYERTFPRLESAADALRFLEDLEQRQVRAYLEGMAELPDQDLRLAVAPIGARQGEHLAVIRALAGQPISPHPFETGAL